MDAPFFHHKIVGEMPVSEFSWAVYWYNFWSPMVIYDKPLGLVSENLLWITRRMGMNFSKDCISYYLEGRVSPEDIASPDEYILYKLCNFFVKGETIDKYSGDFSVDYKNWLAADNDHVFWITMKILNGFGNFNPYRLSNWEFWLNMCFLSQNPHSSRILDVHDTHAKSLKSFPLSPRC